MKHIPFLFLIISIQVFSQSSEEIKLYEDRFQKLVVAYEIDSARIFYKKLILKGVKQKNKNFEVLGYKLYGNLLQQLRKTDSSILIKKKALAINNNIANKFHGDLTANLASSYTQKNIKDSIVFYANEAETTYLKITNYRGLCYLHYTLATYYLQNAQLKQSEEAISKMFGYNEYYKDSYIETLAYTISGTISASLGNNHAARDSFQKSIKLAQEHSYINEYLNSIFGIVGLNILDDRNWKETREYIDECLALLKEKEIPVSPWALVIQGAHITTLFQEGKIQEAEKEIALLKSDAQQFKIPMLQEIVKLNMFELHQNKNNIPGFNELINTFDFNQMSPDGILTYYKIVFNFYHQNNNYSKSIESLKNYYSYKDSISKLTFAKNIAYNQEKYENSKKEKELAEQKIANQEQELLTQKANTRNWLLGLGVLMAIVSAFFIWRKYKSEAKAKETINEQKNLVETLQKELHHRMKNNLSFIDLFINLAKGRFEDEAYQTKLNELQNRMRSMFEVHKQLFKKDDITSVKAKSYIDTLVSNVQKAYAKDNISISNQTDANETILADTSFPVGLIVNEFVTNSYKYAFDDDETGVIDIAIKSENEAYYLLLKDNGKGLPKDFDIDNLDSFGMETIQLLTKEYGGTISIDGTNGVSMNITLPKTAA